MGKSEVLREKNASQLHVSTEALANNASSRKNKFLRATWYLLQTGSTLLALQAIWIPWTPEVNLTFRPQAGMAASWR